MAPDRSTKSAGLGETRFTMIRVDDLLKRVQACLIDLEDQLVRATSRAEAATRVAMLVASVSNDLASMRDALGAYRADMPVNVSGTFVQFPLAPQKVPSPPPDPLTPPGVAVWLLQRTHYLQKLFDEAGHATTAEEVKEALATVSMQVEAFGRKVSRTQQSVAEI